MEICYVSDFLMCDFSVNSVVRIYQIFKSNFTFIIMQNLLLQEFLNNLLTLLSTIHKGAKKKIMLMLSAVTYSIKIKMYRFRTRRLKSSTNDKLH